MLPFFLQTPLNFIFLTYLSLSFHYFLSPFSFFPSIFLYLFSSFPSSLSYLPKFPPFCSFLPSFLYPTLPNSLSLPSFLLLFPISYLFLFFSFYFSSLLTFLSYFSSFVSVLLFFPYCLFTSVFPPPFRFFFLFLLPFLPPSSHPAPHLYSGVQWMMKTSNPPLTNQYQCESEAQKLRAQRGITSSPESHSTALQTLTQERLITACALMCTNPISCIIFKKLTYNTKQLAV